MNSTRNALLWLGVAILGASAFAIIAIHRGETVNAIWLLTAALCTYALGYRFYSSFLANTVLQLNDRRMTPAVRLNDGLDYVPTHKSVLFGHHFAAIAGAGPLVGPVLAAQMGYLPGTLWILVGVVFAGAVQDFFVLFASIRRDGRSLPDMIKTELGPLAGTIAGIGILSIMVILLAVLGLVVIKALAHSPWGTFTIFATIPIAVFMGIYLRFIRPGQVGEISLVGFVLLILSIVAGEKIATGGYANWFDFKGETLAIMLIIYGFIASVLPVWFLLAPRDYLSTFLKIGTIVGLAIGIVFALPELHMPAISKFTDGSGPVFAGSLFPFLFITIACGSISGFHALVSSGTTPKMVAVESHARFIGYGAMLMESFVAIMALIAACALEPGVYFALNSPAALIGASADSAAQAISSWGFTVSADTINLVAKEIGETSILSRTGGAPTLAVGMAKIISGVFNSPGMTAFWYHFAILFEALFILTTIDAGTRVGRFLIQDLIGSLHKPFAKTQSTFANLIATALCVTGWGYFLYQGVIDPLGGINTLWPLFGIANQMLAGMALLFVTTVLFKMKKQKYAIITIAPTAWVLITTLTAAWQKLFSENPKIGFLSHAQKYQTALEQGQILPPANSLTSMQQIILNDHIDASLCLFFMSVVVAILLISVFTWRKALLVQQPTHKESDFIENEEQGAQVYG